MRRISLQEQAKLKDLLDATTNLINVMSRVLSKDHLSKWREVCHEQAAPQTKKKMTTRKTWAKSARTVKKVIKAVSMISLVPIASTPTPLNRSSKVNRKHTWVRITSIMIRECYQSIFLLKATNHRLRSRRQSQWLVFHRALVSGLKCTV